MAYPLQGRCVGKAQHGRQILGSMSRGGYSLGKTHEGSSAISLHNVLRNDDFGFMYRNMQRHYSAA
jgi:hypothetical protein